MSPGRSKRGVTKPRRFRLRKPTWRGWFAIGLGTAVAVIVTLWAIDYATLENRVARNVTVENVDLGHQSGVELQSALRRADAAYGEGTVVFVIGGELHPMSAVDIGLHIDDDATSAAAYRIGRDDPAALKPVYWLASFVQPRRAPVTVDLDRTKLTDALATLPGQIPVVEPHVVGSVEAIGTSPGARGYGFDPDRVAGQIEDQARDGTMPLRIPLAARIIEPSITDGQVNLLAAHAKTLTDRDISLSIPGANMTATPPLLRSWITSEVSPKTGHARLTMDTDVLIRDLQDEMGTVITTPVAATFTVEDSKVYLVPQVDGLECCAESSGSAILDALENDEPSVELPLVDKPPTFTTAKARDLGITTRLGADSTADSQRIWSPDTTQPSDDSDAAPGDDSGVEPANTTTTSTTTTTTLPHDPAAEGQFIVPIPNRAGQVLNVDTAIPLLNGRILLPGEKLSLNDALGAPSRERDFVPADVQTADGPSWISGGGNDLIAAALFEAAYAVGLDIPVSAPHDVVPAGVTPGIEASLGWTEPDLVIANPSEHGVLVWVDRTSGGVRVQLFGTPFIESVDTAQSENRFGPGNACLAVKTTRTRVFVDDVDDVVDRFDARYTPPPAARDDPDRVTCPD